MMRRLLTLFTTALLSLTSCAVGVKKTASDYSLDQAMEVMAKIYYDRLSLKDKARVNVVEVEHIDSVFRKNRVGDTTVVTAYYPNMGKVVFFSISENEALKFSEEDLPNCYTKIGNTLFLWTDKSRVQSLPEEIVSILYRLDLIAIVDFFYFDEYGSEDEFKPLTQIFYRKDNPYINKVIMSPFVIYEPPVL